MGRQVGWRWAFLFLVALSVTAALSLAAGCRGPAGQAPSTAVTPSASASSSATGATGMAGVTGADGLPDCSGAACLQLAENAERERDFFGVRDALRRGCETGSLDACLRLARPDAPFLRKRDEWRDAIKRSCELGSMYGCLFACEDRDDERDHHELECPPLATHLSECKPKKRESTICDRLEPGYELEIRDHCPHEGPLPRCELRASFGRAFLARDTEEQMEVLCRRGSAWGCAQALDYASLSPGEREDPDTCEDGSECTESKKTRAIERRAEQLCAAGAVDACLALMKVDARELAALCRRGHPTACEQVLTTDDPSAAEVACIEGESRACTVLIALAKDVAAKHQLFARICAADFPVCLAGREAFLQPDKQRQREPAPIVALRPTRCAAVVSHVRSLAGVAAPPEDPAATRHCETQLSEAARACLAGAASIDEVPLCEHARTTP